MLAPITLPCSTFTCVLPLPFLLQHCCTILCLTVTVFAGIFLHSEVLTYTHILLLQTYWRRMALTFKESHLLFFIAFVFHYSSHIDFISTKIKKVVESFREETKKIHFLISVQNLISLISYCASTSFIFFVYHPEVPKFWGKKRAHFSIARWYTSHQMRRPPLWWCRSRVYVLPPQCECQIFGREVRNCHLIVYLYGSSGRLARR